MSRVKNVQFSEGETWVIEATFTDSDGLPLNLTGALVTWVVATRPGQAAIVTATSANGLIAINAVPTTGLAVITVPYASHSAALPRSYQHEARVTLASGEVTVQFKGRLTVTDSLYVV